MKTTKIWLGIGVAVVAGASPAGRSDAGELLNTASPSAAHALQTKSAYSSSQYVLGEGGENESGEGGIDAEAADKDPVKYGIALQVIAAHYRAGLAAYEAGEIAAGTQMFAHGHSEVYAEMEDIFKKRGVKDLGTKIEVVLAASNNKAPAAEVKKAVEQVYAALAAAEKSAPKSPLSPLAVKAQVVADMLDRAASQYVLTQKPDATLETYLDGLGFAAAANAEASAILPQVEKVNPEAAKAMRSALELARAAYPGLKRGAAIDAPKFLAAASAARIAAGHLR